MNAIKACELTLEEVDDFRDLYMGGGWNFDRNGMDFVQLERMLRTICKMTMDDKATLKTIFEAVSSSKKYIDFAEFLILMHRLIETNFCQLGDNLKHGV